MVRRARTREEREIAEEREREREELRLAGKAAGTGKRKKGGEEEEGGLSEAELIRMRIGADVGTLLASKSMSGTECMLPYHCATRALRHVRY